MTQGDGAFRGAKLLLFLGPELLVIRRDRRRGIPWPGYLDFPGGGREGQETPEACVLRETREEVGLCLSEADLIWQYETMRQEMRNWFFAARLDAELCAEVRLGSEGSGWMTMPPEAYLRRADTIPHFRDVLRAFTRSP